MASHTGFEASQASNDDLLSHIMPSHGLPGKVLMGRGISGDSGGSMSSAYAFGSNFGSRAPSGYGRSVSPLLSESESESESD